MGLKFESNLTGALLSVISLLFAVWFSYQTSTGAKMGPKTYLIWAANLLMSLVKPRQVLHDFARPSV